MPVLAWSHFGLTADSWELTVQVPFSLGGDVFMMCRTIGSTTALIPRRAAGLAVCILCVRVLRSCVLLSAVISTL